jgi:hypothetical protein
MPPSPDSEENPYAPPAEEVSAVADQTRVRRPVSVTLTLGYFILATVFSWVSAWNLIRNMQKIQALMAEMMEREAGPPIILPELFMRPALRTIVLIILFAGSRRPFGYWTGVIALGLSCCYHVMSRVGDLGNAELMSDSGAKMLTVLLIFIDLNILVLFYRFTFGRPSRAFYRVAASQV